MGKKKLDSYFEERFWSFVDKRGSCWLWTGKRNHLGYGLFTGRIDGVDYDKAHRYSWALHNGPIPEGLLVLHTCDNRWCVNHDHLWLGTQKENIHDARDKGRIPSGANHCNAKLTEDQARMAKYTDIDANALARCWNVDPSAIMKIRSGDNWKHL